LQDIVNNQIKENEIETIEKTLEKIENYLFVKEKEWFQKIDFEYLKNIAEILRNQKVRIEDGVYVENPVFKVSVEGKDNYAFYFLTREGANKFIKSNETMINDIYKENIKNTNEDERRSEQLFNIEKNKNLELQRLLEIIKRNF
jgi:predicted transcriptional regulator